MITVLEKMECNEVIGKALDGGVASLTVDHYGVDMSSVDTSFMRMIRTFCNNGLVAIPETLEQAVKLNPYWYVGSIAAVAVVVNTSVPAPSIPTRAPKV